MSDDHQGRTLAFACLIFACLIFAAFLAGILTGRYATTVPNPPEVPVGP